MMKAITVWQPWASLIAIGAKPYEFRGWQPPRAIIGQRITEDSGRFTVLSVKDNETPIATDASREEAEAAIETDWRAT
jgi:hypothetical protein